MAAAGEELEQLVTTRDRLEREQDRILELHFADAIDITQFRRHQDRIAAGLEDVPNKARRTPQRLLRGERSPRRQHRPPRELPREPITLRRHQPTPLQPGFLQEDLRRQRRRAKRGRGAKTVKHDSLTRRLARAATKVRSGNVERISSSDFMDLRGDVCESITRLKISDTDRNEAIQLFRSGAYVKDIASELKLTRASVREILYDAGASAPPQRMSKAEIKEAARRYEDGDSRPSERAIRVQPGHDPQQAPPSRRPDAADVGASVVSPGHIEVSQGCGPSWVCSVSPLPPGSLERPAGQSEPCSLTRCRPVLARYASTDARMLGCSDAYDEDERDFFVIATRSMTRLMIRPSVMVTIDPSIPTPSPDSHSGPWRWATSRPGSVGTPETLSPKIAVCVKFHAACMPIANQRRRVRRYAAPKRRPAWSAMPMAPSSDE